MSQLVQVTTAETEFSPSPITDEDAAVAFRACLNLFRLWRLSDAEAATLLDLPARTYARWKMAGPGRADRDQKARLSNLLGIHKALRLIFDDSSRVYDWIRRPNTVFGRPALDIMLGGELTDLMRVRRYLDSERGGW